MTTFAVIKTGGKQYKVSEGDVLMIEKLAGVTRPTTDTVSGLGKDEVSFDQVLLVSDGDKSKIGQPTVTGAKVTAKVLVAEGKGEKKMVFKFKAKTRQRKKKGHRQPFTKVQITKITA